jgi:hypothetical protein
VEARSSCFSPDASDKQAVVLDPDVIPVESPRRRAAQNLTLNTEGGSVARTEEFPGLFHPVIGATQMGALRRQSDDLLVVLANHPGRVFLGYDLPSVDPVAAENDFFRLVDGEFRYVAGIFPAGLFARSGSGKQINGRG